MYKVIIFSALISSLANASYTVDGLPRIKKNKSELSAFKKENMSVEFHVGSQRTLNGPDDSTGTKISVTFSKYFNDFSISPQFSSTFFKDDGNETLALQNQSFEAELWGKYRFWRNTTFHIYGGAGMGARRDSIKTTLMGETNFTDSEYYTLLSAALGTQWEPSVSLAGLRFSLELQFHMVPAYNYQDVAVLVGSGVWF
ncbi:MAG: hypothetical protein A4S09_05880 [Proteobacteria bacterium SG_bin7]|nr:MAG: hypothetical protein A4S09_05880 [Proteobacteria bacterium SG_bin7]